MSPTHTTAKKTSHSDKKRQKADSQTFTRLLKMYDEKLQLEEAEACLMSESERETLNKCFASVKFEFSDLDGLSWSPAAKYRGTSLNHRRPPQTRDPSDSTPFALLTNDDLAVFSPEETIRVKTPPKSMLSSYRPSRSPCSFSRSRAKSISVPSTPHGREDDFFEEGNSMIASPEEFDLETDFEPSPDIPACPWDLIPVPSKERPIPLSSPRQTLTRNKSSRHLTVPLKLDGRDIKPTIQGHRKESLHVRTADLPSSLNRDSLGKHSVLPKKPSKKSELRRLRGMCPTEGEP